MGNEDEQKKYYYSWRKGIETEKICLCPWFHTNLMDRLKNECFLIKFWFRRISRIGKLVKYLKRENACAHTFFSPNKNNEGREW